MSKNYKIPSYANFTRYGNTRRDDQAGIFKVDVIMGIKLMYVSHLHSLRYSDHRQGEDFGFAENAKELGLKFGYDGRVISKHVMETYQLLLVDPRVGF